ncbi:MAG: transcription termination/antitermination protein NusG [Chloroflexota bacterium]
MAAARWYVVRTQARHEAQVEALFCARGIEVFLPRLLGRKKDVCGRRRLEPLFPSYLFSHFVVPSQQWLAARSAPGVKYFLGTRVGDSPAALPDELVEEIRAQCALRLQGGWLPAFKAGDKVQICDGPFAGLEAMFDGLLSPSGRSRVFVAFLSRLVPVEVEIDQLERAG